MNCACRKPIGSVFGSSQTAVIDRICDDFEQRLNAGEQPTIEAYLEKFSSRLRGTVLSELVAAEYEYRRRAGEPVSMRDYRRRFPADVAAVDASEAILSYDEQLVRDGATRSGPSMARSIETVQPRQRSDRREENELPDWIGRYRVVRQLGAGGFGRVFLTRDERLHRVVAVKVPHARFISRAEDVRMCLAEAQILASLDHPYIVPVYDVGSTDECPCYVVLKYIEGTDLASRIKQNPLTPHAAAGLTTKVAMALHHAHTHGIIHCDVKPSNILLDGMDTPYVIDFGLAARESELRKRQYCAGTPAYMSPEQAEGTGHGVDGRSDVYSLGAVFYELLTGRRVFTATSYSELCELILNHEPIPPRQIDERIPRELERICLRAISKKTHDRYATARELADDLRKSGERCAALAPEGLVQRVA